MLYVLVCSLWIFSSPNSFLTLWMSVLIVLQYSHISIGLLGAAEANCFSYGLIWWASSWGRSSFLVRNMGIWWTSWQENAGKSTIVLMRTWRPKEDPYASYSSSAWWMWIDSCEIYTWRMQGATWCRVFGEFWGPVRHAYNVTRCILPIAMFKLLKNKHCWFLLYSLLKILSFEFTKLAMIRNG